jgi:hypothetical protein
LLAASGGTQSFSMNLSWLLSFQSLSFYLTMGLVPFPMGVDV